MLHRIGIILVLLGVIPSSASASSLQLLPLTKVADVPLGGRPTRMDYESYDPGRHLLFIAHLGDSTVIAFNTQTHRIKAKITGISHVHGVLVIPSLNRVYVTATGSNEVVAIDENTLKEISRAPTGAHPDGMTYAPYANKLYISDEVGETDTVIDIRSNKRVATIKLGGGVGNSQYDPVSKHVFVNVQTLGQLAEIDPSTDQVISRTDLPGIKGNQDANHLLRGLNGNHGLLIVPEQHLAFISSEYNAKLLIFNMATRRVVASFDVGPNPDVLAMDPLRGWVYLAGEKGVLSIFKVQKGIVTKIAEGRVGPNAHSVAVDPISHQIYFPLENLHGKTALRIMQPNS